MSDVAFREAVGDDWAAIWPIFREVVSEGTTYAFPRDMPEADARRAWMPSGVPGHRTYVAEQDGAIVATAFLKANHDGPGDHVANAGWMVAPASSGRGIGRAFALHVMDEARALGYQGMQFNAVVATNRWAIALWKSLGFRVVGTVPTAFRHPEEGLTDLHIMYREL